MAGDSHICGVGGAVGGDFEAAWRRDRKIGREICAGDGEALPGRWSSDCGREGSKVTGRGNGRRRSDDAGHRDGKSRSPGAAQGEITRIRSGRRRRQTHKNAPVHHTAGRRNEGNGAGECRSPAERHLKTGGCGHGDTAGQAGAADQKRLLGRGDIGAGRKAGERTGQIEARSSRHDAGRCHRAPSGARRRDGNIARDRARCSRRGDAHGDRPRNRTAGWSERDA